MVIESADVITSEQIALFKNLSEQDWDKSNAAHRDAKDVFAKMLDNLHSAVKDAVRKFWDRDDIQIRIGKLLTQPAPTTPSFQKYLVVIFGEPGKYSDIVRYWAFIEGKRNTASLRVSLALIDRNASPKFRQHAYAIQEKFSLYNSKSIDTEISVNQLSDWIVESISNFSLTYGQFCQQLQPQLDEEVVRLNKKKGSMIPSNNGEEEKVESPIDQANCLKHKPKNLIYYGPPGTGKTHRLVQDRANYGESFTTFVTFHQSYGYEEFVEGLRPVLDEGNDNTLQYRIEDGAFKKLCDQARHRPTERFAMVIDEINRGNISKIFGELITLIEPDKRGLEVTLAYSKKVFSVPPNVDIIGTMNTADRSLALLDTALRRRFEFQAVYPDTRSERDRDDEYSAPLAGLHIHGIDVRRMLEQINRRVEVLYDRDHCIGHAYFTRLKDYHNANLAFQELGNIFRKQIVPLLEEYFFEDWEKISLILGDNQKTKDELTFMERSHESERDRLFGREFRAENDSLKTSYRWRESAFREVAAYIGIYSPE